MSINRVSKPSVSPPLSAPTSAPRAADASAPFASSQATKSTAAEAVARTGPLAELRAGRIDRAQYLAAKVDGALEHLRGLAPSELSTIREHLLSRLETDPALSALVEKATGCKPTR